MDHSGHEAMPTTVGEVDHARNGFNPSDILTDFDYGDGIDAGEWADPARVRHLPRSTRRSRWRRASSFPAWTYNGRIPGPTIRCTEGDRIRIHFSNGSAHPHTMHFHGFHPAEMDGVPRSVRD